MQLRNYYLVGAALLVACSGSSDHEAAKTVAPMLAEAVDEAPGANCPAGGVALRLGTDLNGDGKLQASEINSTSYVCRDTSPCGTLESAECAGVDLRGTLIGYYNGSLIKGANFQGADLSYAVFVGVHIADSNFDGAKLTGARFFDAAFLGSSFKGANFSGTAGKADVDYTDFEGANFDASSLEFRIRYNNFTGASFAGADLRGMDILAGNDFSKASFNNAWLTSLEIAEHNSFVEADFTRASLRATDFSDATTTDAVFTDAIYDAATDGITPTEAHLVGPDEDLSELDLSGMDFTAADLSGATLTDADLTGAALDGANLSDADLDGANAPGASFAGADLTFATAQNADFSEANLIGTTLLVAGLSNANLSRANLTGANVGDAFDNGAILTGADLTRATLIGVDFSDVANVDSVTWSNAYYDDTTELNGISSSELTSVQELNASGNYSYVWMPHRNLQDADLAGANFTGAKLLGDFRRANLSEANFTGARISAILIGADLSGANFSGASLAFVPFWGADFSEAIFDNTICGDGRNSDENGGTCEHTHAPEIILGA